ncbi:MdfA family multidrug efflux MFS transporter [Legionella londiniensis]|uniref:Multidrug transporter MdfA n=1 Tax=Legionella londiniensis TaxID=45068 RepID=A0A0W0VKP3_9GAMM|nr:MdfA family multidrug efflux MFS transporter [Legionella londiniensis]KTD20654.1 multidrug efflux system protein [Legionella londiniensis]STX92875.1 multidrug efflux system protein [Legionella londiniensis]
MSQPLINITRKQAFIFAAFLVFYEFLTYIANDMIMPGMIQVVKTLNGPESAVASSLTFYILGGASLQLFLGPLSDYYGRRPVMLSGAALFLICTVFIASSQSMEQFLMARFFQGMGLCFIGVVGYATLQEIFAEMDAIRLIAIMANVSILAPLLGPLLGAVFIHYFSWRLIFVFIGLGALIALWGLYRHMPEPVGQMKTDGEEIKRVPLSPKVIAANYKNLLLNRAFLFGSIALGVLGLPCVAWIALAPVMLIADAKLSVIEYGLWQIPVFGAAILGNWFLQKLTKHYSSRMILFLGSMIVAVSLLLALLLPLLLANHFLWLMPGLIFYFFGLGITNAPLDRIILFSTPIAKGTASALMTLIAMFIQALGIEGMNVLYTSRQYTLFGLCCGLLALVYLMLLGIAFLTVIRPGSGKSLKVLFGQQTP